MSNLKTVPFETIKTVYICEGLTPVELSKRFDLPVSFVENFIAENKLEDLRTAYVKNGLIKLQNIQIGQAEKLMDMDTQFKKMRIIQLEARLNDFLAYYAKYNHFYKIHPITGEILKDTNGIPIQIPIPNVSKEIAELKEVVSLSEGLKGLLKNIDDIINKPRDNEDANTLDAEFKDVGNFNDLFKPNKRDDD